MIKFFTQWKSEKRKAKSEKKKVERREYVPATRRWAQGSVNSDSGSGSNINGNGNNDQAVQRRTAVTTAPSARRAGHVACQCSQRSRSRSGGGGRCYGDGNACDVSLASDGEFRHHAERLRGHLARR